MTALPEPERDALVLHVWESLSYEEIAAALDVPVGTVRSRLNRARRRLRELAAPRGRERVVTEATDSNETGDTVEVTVVTGDHMAVIDLAGEAWRRTVDWLAARRTPAVDRTTLVP